MRIFIISECQRGFAGGIQQYIFSHVISTHREGYIDVLLCLTPTKKDIECLNKIQGYSNIYCISLYAPSRFHALINIIRILIKVGKYKKIVKIIVYSSPGIHSFILALLKFNQVLYLLQRPMFYALSFLVYSLLSRFSTIQYIASDAYIYYTYKSMVKKNISIFFPDFSKIFANLHEKLPEELKIIEARLYNAQPIITYIGYIDYPRFSLPHFIVFLKFLKLLEKIKTKNPLVILVIRPTRYSDKFVNYLITKLTSLKLNNNVIIIDRFLTIEEKLAILRRSTAVMYFLLDIHPALQPTIPPITLAEYVALGKPVIFFINGLDKLKTLGSFYIKWKNYMHIIDINSDDYILYLRKTVENILTKLES